MNFVPNGILGYEPLCGTGRLCRHIQRGGGGGYMYRVVPRGHKRSMQYGHETVHLYMRGSSRQCSRKKSRIWGRGWVGPDYASTNTGCLAR